MLFYGSRSYSRGILAHDIRDGGARQVLDLKKGLFVFFHPLAPKLTHIYVSPLLTVCPQLNPSHLVDRSGKGGGGPKKVSFSFSSSALRLAHPILRVISWAAWGGEGQKKLVLFLLPYF